MKESLFELITPEHDNTFLEITDSLEEVVLFCDDHGIVIKSSIGARNFWGKDIINVPLWVLLEIDIANINALFTKHPAGRTSSISLTDKGECNLWVMPIPNVLAPNGGLVATLTPIEGLRETYEECIQDNIVARKDSFKLFGALFDAAPDSTILVDEQLTILSANPAAVKRFNIPNDEQNPSSFLPFIKKSLREIVKSSIANLKEGKPWCGEFIALNSSQEEIPIMLTAKQIRLSDQLLFQLIIKDLSMRMELEENLKEREEELESMDNTLRTVIRSVEEEKQEYREEVIEQVKEYLLPTIDRIAEAPSQTLRKSYSGILKSHIEDFSDNTGELPDELLSLSSRQLEICKLVYVGMKGKEIAELLGISFETLQSHRKNIRKKLKLCGTNISLQAYLENKTDFDPS